MSELTEAEIFDCLRTNLRLAAEHCDRLAVSPKKGLLYHQLRENLLLIEGACRQACYWREDARWLPLAFLMSEAHKRAGNWLRAHQPAKLFNLLADNLRKALVIAEQIETKATGRRGMILPDPVAVHRDTRPVQVLLPPPMRTSGIILP